MAWTYDPAELEKALNWVRFRIGDTDTNDQQLSDEEINSLISLHAPSMHEAAAVAAEAIAGKYSRLGALGEVDTYKQLAAELRRTGMLEYL